MIKFPKIGQFKNMLHEVAHIGMKDPMSFTGTVKLHGTNAAVVFGDEGEVSYQSRMRIIEVGDDNMGFASFMENQPDEVKEIMNIRNFAIFGEWCGGNIQGSVGLAALPKMFVIFAVRNLRDNSWIAVNSSIGADDDEEIAILNANGIYWIDQFPTYKVEVDFERPGFAQAKMVEITQAVEAECPVAKQLGIEGGTGEGVVWTPDNHLTSIFWFKVKGEKHSASKVKTLAPIDPERVKSVVEFVAMTVTENRLNQGLEVLRQLGLPVDKSSTGTYMKWIVNDIHDEEGDSLAASGLTEKDVNRALSMKARTFFFNKCDEV